MEEKDDKKVLEEKVAESPFIHIVVEGNNVNVTADGFPNAIAIILTLQSAIGVVNSQIQKESSLILKPRGRA